MTAAVGRGRIALLAVVGVSLVAGALTSSPVQAEPAATSILDVTFECAVELRGGAYILEARAHSGTRRQAAWGRLPYGGIRTGNFGGTAGNMLAWVTAGRPVPTTVIDNEYETFDVKTFGTAGTRRAPCRRTTAKVPLSPAGLTGGAASPLGTEVECFTARRVLVRIRTDLLAKGSFRRGAVYETVHVPARGAQLAVRAPSGKPLVYADAVESGRARLFTAKGCIQR